MLHATGAPHWRCTVAAGYPCRVLCQCTCIECVWLQLLAFAGSYVVSYVSVCHCLMSVYYVRGTQLLFPFITSNCAVTSETSCRS